MQFFTLYLPVKTYVRKYLHATYGELHLPQDSTFSNVIMAYLFTRLPVKLGKIRLDQQLERYQDKLSIRVSSDLFYRLPGQAIGKDAAVHINRYFENLFREDFCRAVQHMVQYMHLDRQEAIEAYCELNGLELEEDITFDALKKMEYRYRKEREEKSVAQLSRASLFARSA